MSYEDLLKKYQRLDRTRIFGPDWRITQQWTSLHVPWSADYHQTRFSVKVTRNTPVVIVMSQLDDTYFAGLVGKYEFKLQFRVQQADDEENYIVRSNINYYMTRSVSTDIDLEAGSYVILVKITATRIGGSSMDEVIARHAEYMRDKLLQVGLSYDIAHAKGVIVETDKEREDREMSEKIAAAKAREKRKNAAKMRKMEQWKREKKHEKRTNMRARRRQRREEEHDANRRLLELDDGYRPSEERMSRRGDYSSTHLGHPNPIPTGDGSFTGEFIASYQRSEGHPSPPPSPKTPETEDDASHRSKVIHVSSVPHRVPTAVQSEVAHTVPPANSLEVNPPTPKVQINGIDAVTKVKPLKKRPTPLIREAILEATTVEPAETCAEDRRPNEDYRPTQRQDSWPTNYDDTDSEFDWQTDLDYDSDEERARQPKRASHRRNQNCPDNGGQDDDDEEGEEGDEDDDHGGGGGSGDPSSKIPAQDLEPWNAVCVVGLRVYSKDADLSVEVVRPNPYGGRDADLHGRDRRAGLGGEALDLDDPAKGAVAEKWAMTPMREAFDLA
jgi:hypothetical protein